MVSTQINSAAHVWHPQNPDSTSETDKDSNRQQAQASLPWKALSSSNLSLNKQLYFKESSKRLCPKQKVP